MRLFSNRSQMTSKCGKNKKSGTRGDIRVCHWCSYHILTSSAIYYWTEARQHGIYLFCIITKQNATDKAFNFKTLSTYADLCPRPMWRTRKKAIWHNLLSIESETISLATMRSKDLWLVQENHATVKPGSRRVIPCGMKTYSETRIELRNLQILKKLLSKSSQFLSSEQPCEPKSLGVVLNIAGVEKIPSANLCLQSV